MLRPPFTALSMNELSVKACRGVYPALSSKYSKSLSLVIKKMIQVLPSKRPTSSELLEMPDLTANMGKTCAKLSAENMNKDLLGTIMMPKKLNELARRLPRPKYSRRRLKRTNSEPCRLPSVHESRSRAGSASSRKQWDLGNKQPVAGFEPRSAINSKKKSEDYHLLKSTRSQRYFSKENIDRSVLQRAAENIVPQNKVRHIDFRRRNSENSRYSEERKVPPNGLHAERRPSANRNVQRPPLGTPGMQKAPGAELGLKPPLANINQNIPHPKIVNPYDAAQGFGKRDNTPGRQNRFGLPPIGQKPGFGGMNHVKRNVIHEQYNHAGGFGMNRNRSPYRF